MRDLYLRKLLLLLFLNTTTILIISQEVSLSKDAYSPAADDAIYNIFFSQDFEHHQAPIEYTKDLWNPDWNYPGWRDGDHRPEGWWAENIKDSIVVDRETNSTVMKFNFKDTIINGVTGYYPIRGGDHWITELGLEAKEIYFSYNVKFRPGFEWNLGGKLPSTRGGTPLSKETLSASLPPQEGEGFKASLMFKSEGKIEWYLYHHNQIKEMYGDNITWNDYQPDGLSYTEKGAVSLDVTNERWHNITMRIVVNSFSNGVPNEDGILEGFVDGKLVSSIQELYLLTASDVDRGVNVVNLTHFFGGTGNQFGPLRDEWTLFDDFICFTYDDGLNVPRGNTPSKEGRVLLLPNLKTSQPEQIDIEPPSIPEGLRNTKKTGTFLDLVWNSSQDNTAVEGYNVFLNGHKKGSTKFNYFKIDELESNTTYSISVSAYDRFSNESDRSEAIFASTLEIDTLPPPRPSGVHLETVTESSVKLAWDEFPDSIDYEEYNIYSSDTLVASTGSSSYVIENLQPSSVYVFTVTAFDASFNESPHSDPPVTAITKTKDTEAPTTPERLTATEVTENSISITWDPSVDNSGVFGYRIYLNGILKDNSLTTSYTINELYPGVNYSISVSALDHTLNESARSKEIFEKTENPENTTFAALPEVKITDFVNSVSGTTASAVAEIQSFGHTELLDYGLMVTKKGSDLDEDHRDVIYAKREYSELIHTNRVQDGIQLLYDFNEGEGNLIYDKSESVNSVDLMINNPLVTSWLPGQGLKVDNCTLISSAEVPTGMLNSISATNEITLESWIRTGAIDQSGPARIISISRDSRNRVATLGQQGNDDSYNYIARLTTTTTSLNGTPEVASIDEFNGLNLHHLVYTRSNEGIEKIYINGEEKYSGLREGSISITGDNNYVALANELSGERPWIGNFYLVAVYNKALEEKDISKNYEAGTGVVKYSANLSIEPDESYVVTPFARTVQGIAYGEPVELNAKDVLHDIREDSIYIKIYPNPSQGDFHILVKCNVSDAQMAYLRVSDMMGQVVHYERLPISDITEEPQFINGGDSVVLTTGKDFEINLSSQLIDGIYLVTLIVGDQAVGERLLIQH